MVEYLDLGGLDVVDLVQVVGHIVEGHLARDDKLHLEQLNREVALCLLTHSLQSWGLSVFFTFFQ